MLEEKQLKEIETKIKEHIRDRQIKTKGNKK